VGFFGFRRRRYLAPLLDEIAFAAALLAAAGEPDELSIG
jgi:hypothetical protein